MATTMAQKSIVHAQSRVRKKHEGLIQTSKTSSQIRLPQATSLSARRLPSRLFHLQLRYRRTRLARVSVCKQNDSSPGDDVSAPGSRANMGPSDWISALLTGSSPNTEARSAPQNDDSGSTRHYQVHDGGELARLLTMLAPTREGGYQYDARIADAIADDALARAAPPVRQQAVLCAMLGMAGFTDSTHTMDPRATVQDLDDLWRNINRSMSTTGCAYRGSYYVGTCVKWKVDAPFALRASGRSEILDATAFRWLWRRAMAHTTIEGKLLLSRLFRRRPCPFGQPMASPLEDGDLCYTTAGRAGAEPHDASALAEAFLDTLAALAAQAASPHAPPAGDLRAPPAGDLRKDCARAALDMVAALQADISTREPYCGPTSGAGAFSRKPMAWHLYSLTDVPDVPFRDWQLAEAIANARKARSPQVVDELVAALMSMPGLDAGAWPRACSACVHNPVTNNAVLLDHHLADDDVTHTSLYLRHNPPSHNRSLDYL